MTASVLAPIPGLPIFFRITGSGSDRDANMMHWIETRILRLFSVVILGLTGAWLPLFPGAFYLCVGIGIAFDVIRYYLSCHKGLASCLAMGAASLCAAAAFEVARAGALGIADWSFRLAIVEVLVLGLLAVILVSADESLARASRHVRDMSELRPWPERDRSNIRCMIVVAMAFNAALMIAAGDPFHWSLLGRIVPFWSYDGFSRLQSYETMPPSYLTHIKVVVLSEVAVLLVTAAALAAWVQRQAANTRARRSTAAN